VTITSKAIDQFNGEVSLTELDQVTGGATEFGIFDTIADGVAAVFGRDGQGRNLIHHFTGSGSVTNQR
jgi:hypothetical protein